jgi:hypothetical protein
MGVLVHNHPLHCDGCEHSALDNGVDSFSYYSIIRDSGFVYSSSFLLLKKLVYVNNNASLFDNPLSQTSLNFLHCIPHIHILNLLKTSQIHTIRIFTFPMT